MNSIFKKKPRAAGATKRKAPLKLVKTDPPAKPKPRPAPPPPPRAAPAPLRADPLAGLANQVKRESFRATCKHPVLRFERFGGFLRCIDCRRRYIVCLDDFEAPDFLYTHPALTEQETRQDPFAAPRTTPVVPAGVKL